MKKLFKMIRQGNLEEVKRILEKKPDLIACTATAPPKKDDGQSPLMVAIKSDNLEVAHLLLDYGADVNFVNGHAPLESYDIFAPIWDNALGQCFLRARDTVSEQSKERTEQYFQLLCRLLDMGMDINQEITYSSMCRPKNAWRAALEEYNHFALTSYSTYNIEGNKAQNQQLQNWLCRILDVLEAYGAFIYDFHIEGESSEYDDIDRIIRNMVFNQDIHNSIRTATEYELKYCPQWFEIKWRPIDSILRRYYEKENPYYGAEVSLERKLFFENLAQRENKKPIGF